MNVPKAREGEGLRQSSHPVQFFFLRSETAPPICGFAKLMPDGNLVDDEIQPKIARLQEVKFPPLFLLPPQPCDIFPTVLSLIKVFLQLCIFLTPFPIHAHCGSVSGRYPKSKVTADDSPPTSVSEFMFQNQSPFCSRNYRILYQSFFIDLFCVFPPRYSSSDSALTVLP